MRIRGLIYCKRLIHKNRLNCFSEMCSLFLAGAVKTRDWFMWIVLEMECVFFEIRSICSFLRLISIETEIFNIPRLQSNYLLKKAKMFRKQPLITYLIKIYTTATTPSHRQCNKESTRFFLISQMTFMDNGCAFHGVLMWHYRIFILIPWWDFIVGDIRNLSVVHVHVVGIFLFCFWPSVKNSCNVNTKKAQ